MRANEVRKVDRRKRKSRKAILDACIELTKEKEFQQITVHEIVERADLNRGTFYLHFVDKVDMMKSFENEMIEKIEEVLVNNIPDKPLIDVFIQSRYDTIVQILRCYEENKEHLQFLITSGNSASFQAQLRDSIKTILVNDIFPKLNVASITIPTDLVAMIFSSISLNLAQYAYEADAPFDVESHAQFLISIMVQGPLKTFGFMSDSFSMPFNEIQTETNRFHGR